jgi:hypothetical protein
MNTAKLRDEQVVVIVARLARGERSSHIARDYGVHRDVISYIARGETWKHIPREASHVAAG